MSQPSKGKWIDKEIKKKYEFILPSFHDEMINYNNAGNKITKW